MKAVNLIPADARRNSGSGGPATESRFPTYILLGVLTIAVAFVTFYVLTANTISERKAKVSTLQAQIVQTQAQSAGLSHYAQFSQLAQSKVASVRQIAATRFDWHAALSALSKVVPANTSLQALNGTAAAPGPAGASSTSTSTPAASGPSIQIAGCTKTQDDVARLISRLRVIDGVTAVTLASSQKQGAAQSGAPLSSSSASGSATSQGCGANTPNFNLTIGFKPVSAITGAAR